MRFSPRGQCDDPLTIDRWSIYRLSAGEVSLHRNEINILLLQTLLYIV